MSLSGNKLDEQPAYRRGTSLEKTSAGCTVNVSTVPRMDQRNKGPANHIQSAGSSRFLHWLVMEASQTLVPCRCELHVGTDVTQHHRNQAFSGIPRYRLGARTPRAMTSHLTAIQVSGENGATPSCHMAASAFTGATNGSRTKSLLSACTRKISSQRSHQPM